MKAPLFGIGMQGKSPVVTAKLLTNFYVDFRPKGEASQVVAHGFPGMNLFIDLGVNGIRGILPIEQVDLLYVEHNSSFWEVNNAGTTVSRGTLSTSSGNVEMAHNGSVMLIVDGTYGYTYTAASTTFAQITDTDFPANPISVTWTGGYFVVGFASGRFYVSTDGISWDALDFANAESNPDALIKVMENQGQLVLFGDISAEFWAQSESSDFPFAKILNADTEWGLAARSSAVKFDNGIAFLCKNRQGSVSVGKLSGYSVKIISTPDMDTIINEYAVTSDATGYAYMHGGHAMYQINFPSAGYSWNYDGMTGFWSKRKSSGLTRHVGAFSAQFLGRTIIADYGAGKLYEVDDDAYTEDGDTIEGEIVGEHLENEMSRLTLSNVRIDMETGVGTTTGQGVDPQIMLQLSRDGGRSWGIERWRSFGKIGEYTKRVEWRRNGTARKWTMKLRITDPVKRTIIGCYVNPND